MMSGLLSTTATSSMRPPIVAGPISRNFTALKIVSTSAALANPEMRIEIRQSATRIRPPCFVVRGGGTRNGEEHTLHSMKRLLLGLAVVGAVALLAAAQTPRPVQRGEGARSAGEGRFEIKVTPEMKRHTNILYTL